MASPIGDLVQAVMAGSYEDAFRAAGIDAGKPGWHDWDILKYIRNVQPGKEVGLKVDSSRPAMFMFSSMEQNSWGNNKSYAIIPGNIAAPDGGCQGIRSRLVSVQC